MENLDVYIPQDRRIALSSGADLPRDTHGAALFADISGFTPLTEGLSRALGPRRGAEELTRQLNLVYDALVAEVDRYGGSVLGFSGDAITCWFDDALVEQHDAFVHPASAAEAHAASRSAVECALAIQRLMARFQTLPLPDGTPVALAIKVVVTSGPARRFVVGDPAYQRIDVLAGATLARIELAEHLVAKAELLVDAATAQYAAPWLTIAEWRADEATGERFALVSAIEPRPAATADTDLLAERQRPLAFEQVRPWLLAAVYERLHAGLGEFLTELRPAVPLFLRFSGIDYDRDPEAGARLHAYICWVQKVLARYEGTLLQLTIGDKGCYLYGAFGAPVAHEDDDLRAVAAAHELLSPPTHLDFIGAPQIGISRGMMRVGAYGGTRRRTYGVLGEDANIAARLMSAAAPRQILVTKRVARAIGGRYQLEELGSIQFKGLAKPLAVLAVGPRRAGAAPQLAGDDLLVGREAERALLRSRLDLLGAGQGGNVLIEGEAGIGKTRLVADLRAQALARGIPCFTSDAEAVEQTTPYHVWRPVFRALFDLSDVDDPALLREHVLVRLPADPEVRERAPLLNVVLPLGLAETELTAQLDGNLRAENTRALLLRLLLDMLVAAPALLIIEDAHWCDSASWALLEQLRISAPALLLVVATRPLDEMSGHPAADIAAEYRNLQRDPATLRMHLGVLDSETIAALICARLGVPSVPAPALELIRRNAEGHPLFSEEIAYALRDMGILRIERGECRMADDAGNLHDLNFPDTLQGVVTSRLDRLPPAQQMALKVASVIGRIFQLRGLQGVYPGDDERQRLPEHMSRLVELDITLLQGNEPELAYIFKHALTREVAYQLLLFSQRRRLHRAVAEWYEQSYADNLAPHYALLAYHWVQSFGDTPDDPAATNTALNYLELAGDQAVQTSAYREAIEFFKEALAIDEWAGGGDALVRARWMGRIGAAYRGWGRYTQSLEWLEGALNLLGEPMPSNGPSMGGRMITEIFRQLLHRIQPRRWIGRADPARRPELHELAAVYQLVSEMTFFANQKGASLYAVLRMMNISEVADARADIGRAAGVMGLTTGMFGLQRLADLYFRRGMAAAEAVNNQLVLGEIWQIHGLYRMGLGQWEQAADYLARSVALHKHLGHRRYMHNSTLLLGQISLYRADFDHGLAVSQEIERAGEKEDNPDYRIWSSAQQSMRLLRLGQLAAAAARIEPSIALAAAHGEDHAALYCRGLLASSLWRSGEQASARRYADEVAALIKQARGIPVGYDTIDGYRAVAEVYLGLWEQAGAAAPRAVKAAARRACRALHTYRRFFPIGEAVAWQFQGQLEWLAGKPKRAHVAWRRSLAAAERMSMPYEQAEACFQIGRHLPAGHPERDPMLQRALATFAHLSAEYDCACVQAALASSERATHG